MTNAHLRSLLGALVVSISTAAFAAPEVSTTHSTVKVRPDDPVPETHPADLLSARNQFVSFQIVVSGGDTGAQNVSARVEPITGPAEISPDNVTLYREEYLNLTNVSFPQATPGRYPDPLVPDVDETVGEKRNAFPFEVPANENRTLWVDVLVPQGTTPGDYQGAIVLTGEGFEQSVPFSLKVVSAELPSTASLKSAFLLNHNMTCLAHTGSRDCNGDAYVGAELRKGYATLALEHRVTLSSITHFPQDGNWASFDALYGPLIDGTAPSRLPGAKMTSVQYMGPREAAEQRAFADHMKEKGWLSLAYDYTGDEPPFGITFEEALSRAQAVKEAAPELRTLLTTTIQAADDHGLSQYLDLITPVINHLDGNEAPYLGDQRPYYDNFVAQPGKELWAYQSCMSHGCAFGTEAPGNDMNGGWPSYMVDASAARNRAMQSAMYAMKATGELYYETALAFDTAWEDIFRFAGNGDGTLFYPGMVSKIGGSTAVPLPSLRMKLIREGMQDYEWLKLVADAGDPEFADRIARSLVPSASKVGDDGMAFVVARRQLIERWQELKGESAASVEPTGASNSDLGAEASAEPGAVGCSAASSGAASGAGIVLALAAMLRRRNTRG